MEMENGKKWDEKLGWRIEGGWDILVKSFSTS